MIPEADFLAAHHGHRLASRQGDGFHFRRLSHLANQSRDCATA
jgi:hypothetical protein